MGLASYVFPTAEHSRFAHSLGVYSTARSAYQHLMLRSADLDLPLTVRFDRDTEKEFCIASLCHDLGHTPFSHVLENTLLPEGFRSHEECTRALLSTESEVGKAIKSISDLEAVRLFLSQEHINKALNVLVSGSFDADRADYILRDSYMCGVNYGQYDLNWLFHSMTIETNLNEQPILVLDGRRGLDSLRQFLSARRYLYRQVYFHSAVRGAQILLKAIFDRIQDLPKNASTKALAPHCLKGLATGQRLSIGEFIAATDIEVLYMVRNFALRHKDATLRYLCRLFLDRQLPKAALDSAKSLHPLTQRGGFKIELQQSIICDDNPGLSVGRQG